MKLVRMNQYLYNIALTECNNGTTKKFPINFKWANLSCATITIELNRSINSKWSIF
jgi:hypothetical protein